MAKLGALLPRLGIFDSRRIKPERKRASSVYCTREWRELVGRLISERGRECQRCGRTHDNDGKPVRIFADHIIELEDGGAAFEESNIQLLDGTCHTRKTAEARARRR